MAIGAKRSATFAKHLSGAHRSDFIFGTSSIAHSKRFSASRFLRYLFLLLRLSRIHRGFKVG